MSELASDSAAYLRDFAAETRMDQWNRDNVPLVVNIRPDNVRSPKIYGDYSYTRSCLFTAHNCVTVGRFLREGLLSAERLHPLLRYGGYCLWVEAML